MRRVLVMVGVLLSAFVAVVAGADADGDGVPDDTDPCPSQPETLSRFAQLDGCPDSATVPTGSANRRGGNDPSLLLGVIYFEDGAAVVAGEDQLVLGQAARRVLSSASGGTVALVGHADAGEPGDHSALARARCEAVRSALGAAGIPSARLGFCYGMADRVPVGDSRLNRRVEIAVKQSVISSYAVGFGDE